MNVTKPFCMISHFMCIEVYKLTLDVSGLSNNFNSPIVSCFFLRRNSNF